MKTIIRDGNYEAGLGFLGTDGEVYSIKINDNGRILGDLSSNGAVGQTGLNIIKDGNYETCLFGVDSTDPTKLIPVQTTSDGKLLVEIDWIEITYLTTENGDILVTENGDNLII